MRLPGTISYQTHSASPLSSVASTIAALPRFYFPEGVAEQLALQQHLTMRTFEFLATFETQLPLLGLKTLLRDTYNMPLLLAYPLLHKIAPGSDNFLSTQALQQWFVSVNFMASSPEKRAFDILRHPERDYIAPVDLRPMLTGILLSHPGLTFLREAPEFQDRYAETVINRIFYRLNPTGGSRISFREMKNGQLLQAFHEVEAEEDVNRCTSFFSYEHFYVIYCKFWDLDNDHDFLLSRDDLLRYANHSLTYRIVDRLFEGHGRPFTSGIPGKMSYEDFVWFILSEEDKSTSTALNYWFRAVDLNGDDRLTFDELLWFYEEQLGRMECLSQETVSFDDVMAQLQDMLNPEDLSCFSMRDLKKSRALAGTLFNVLFNLNKFMAFETRDPFTVRQEREDAMNGASDWDRFAKNEYMRLAIEEDGGGDDDGMPWTDGFDGPL